MSYKIRVMTSNILFSDKDVPMADRVPLLSEVYHTKLPDIIGFQEAKAFYYDSLFPAISDEYEIVSPDADGKHNFAPTAYKKGRFSLVDSGASLLEKRATDTKCLTYALLEAEDGSRLLHVNLHASLILPAHRLDPLTDREDGEKWRCHNARQALKVATWQSRRNGEGNKLPTLITGDLNVREGGDSYKEYLDAGMADAKYAATDATVLHTTTFHAVGKPLVNDDPRPIDFIFVTPENIKVHIYEICRDKVSLGASDHCPVYADIEVG